MFSSNNSYDLFVPYEMVSDLFSYDEWEDRFLPINSNIRRNNLERDERT